MKLNQLLIVTNNYREGARAEGVPKPPPSRAKGARPMAKATRTQTAETPAAKAPETAAVPAPNPAEANGAATPETLRQGLRADATSDLEGLAVRLDALAEEAAGLGEDTVAKA